MNSDPYLGMSNSYIEWLLANMVDDLLNIVVDTYLYPYFDRERLVNDFELLFTEGDSEFSSMFVN